MIFRIVPVFLALVCASSLAADEQGQLDASEPLFVVMAAANAVGYDAGLGSSPEFRQKVRDRIAASHSPVIQELRIWYKANREPDKSADLARFISLGLSLKGAPDFDWLPRTVEVPPDAMAMDEFRKLLPRFYEEAGIEDLWQSAQPSIEKTLESYQEPIAHAVLECNSYLRNPTYGALGRRFQIYIDLLGAPNQVHTRSYGGDYFVVLTPSSDLHIAEVRHAYFRFLLDPLALKYGMELQAKASLMDIAEGAPLLNEPYRSHFDMLASECLIKAIESRLLSNPGLIDQAVRQGFILAPFFNEQLAVYEKSQDVMKLYFPQMVSALSVKREMQRLEGVEFAKQLPPPTTTKSQAPPPIISQSAQTTAEAEAYYDKQDLQNARELYERALQQAGSATDHARAYFGLAHVALRQKRPEAADQYFRKTLDSSPEPDVRAWSCYYLGQLAALSEQPDEALDWYRKVLAVEGAPAKAIEFTRRELAKAAPAAK